jgi:hypothetical protein
VLRARRSHEHIYSATFVPLSSSLSVPLAGILIFVSKAPSSDLLLGLGARVFL